MGAILKQEKFLLLAVIATFFAYGFEHQLLSHGHTVALISGVVLVGFIVCASMRVAHHSSTPVRHGNSLYANFPTTE